jgi:hypothetical protein
VSTIAAPIGLRPVDQLPCAKIFLDPRSADVDIQRYEIKEVFLLIGAARYHLNPEKKEKHERSSVF